MTRPLTEHPPARLHFHLRGFPGAGGRWMVVTNHVLKLLIVTRMLLEIVLPPLKGGFILSRNFFKSRVGGKDWRGGKNINQFKASLLRHFACCIANQIGCEFSAKQWAVRVCPRAPSSRTTSETKNASSISLLVREQRFQLTRKHPSFPQPFQCHVPT